MNFGTLTTVPFPQTDTTPNLTVNCTDGTANATVRMMYLGAGHAIVHAPYTGTSVAVTEYGGRRGATLASPIG